MAIETGKANEQHYEVGTGVLKACLGTRMKYSCCLYEDPSGKELGGAGGLGDGGLDEAEERMLGDYVRKAGLVDGMKVLDLGFVFPFSFFLSSFMWEAEDLLLWLLLTTTWTIYTNQMTKQLRLGLPLPLPRRQISKLQNHRFQQLPFPKGIHRHRRPLPKPN